MYQGWDFGSDSENEEFLANQSEEKDGNGINEIEKKDWNGINEIEHLITQLPYENEEMGASHPYENDETDSEEESDDDSETSNVTKKYKYQMAILIQALKESLSRNLARQAEIDDELMKPAIFQPDTPHQHVSISKRSTTVFCSPYFKNYRNYSHPKNGDTIKKEENKELDVYISYPTVWTKSDKEGLEAAIKDKALMKIPDYRDWILVKDELTRERRLKQVVRNAQKRRDVKMRINMAKKEMEDITNDSEENIFNDRDEDYDWKIISLEEFHGIHSEKSCELQWKNQIHPSLNQTAWSHDEDEILKYLAEIMDATNWNSIAEQLGTNRTPISCMQRYMKKLNVAQSKRRWDKSEDELLLKLVDEHRINNLIPWSKIACHMECRTKDQCWQRYLYSLREDIRRGLFNDEEDMLLLAGVEMYGTDWSKIGNHFTSRTPIQIFSRWNYFLNPDLDFQNWTEEEDSCLLDLVKKYGGKDWLKISKEMDTDRTFTNVQVSRRYKTLKLKLGKLDATRKNPKLKYKNAPGLSSLRQNGVIVKISEAFESWSENYEMETEYDDDEDTIANQNMKRSYEGLFENVSDIKLESFMHHIQGLILQTTNKRKHDNQSSGTSQSRKPNTNLSEEDARQMTIASQCINKMGDFPSIEIDEHDSTWEHQEDQLLIAPEIVEHNFEDEEKVFFGNFSSYENFKNVINEGESIQQLLDETIDILPTLPKDADTINEVDEEIVHRGRPRYCGDGLDVEWEILNTSNSDKTEKMTNMTIIPPNQKSLTGFKELLLERMHFENFTLRETLKDSTSNDQRTNNSEQNKRSPLEATVSQEEADLLLSRRVVKLFLLPAKMSLKQNPDILPVGDSQEESWGDDLSLSREISPIEDRLTQAQGMVVQKECDSIPTSPEPVTKSIKRKLKRKRLSNV